MEVSIALGASPNQVYLFFDKLRLRGFELSETKYGNPQAVRKYYDLSGHYKCSVNVGTYKFGEGSGFYEYTVYVESAAKDAVTGEPVESEELRNGYSFTTQDNERITRFTYFIDSILTQAECVGLPTPLAVDEVREGEYRIKF
jgi:hypothetical protein